MSPERELPPLHFKSVESLPPEDPSTHDKNENSEGLRRNYNYEADRAEHDFDDLLHHTNNSYINKKLQAIDELRKRLEDAYDSQFEADNRFANIISRSYYDFIDSKSVKKTFINFNKVFEYTGVKPHKFFSDFTFDESDFRNLNDVFNNPEIYIFAKIIADDTTSKARMRELKERVAGTDPKLQHDDMCRLALKITNMTPEKAEVAYRYFIQIFLEEGRKNDLEEYEWQTIDLAFELRKYFDIKSAGLKEENEQVEDRYQKIIQEFLQKIFSSTLSGSHFLYICERFKNDVDDLNLIHLMPVPGIFAPQKEVEMAYDRLSSKNKHGFDDGILGRMVEFKKVAGVPPHDKGIVVRVLIDVLNNTQDNNAKVLQCVAWAEELMETSFASDENSRKEIYDAILTGQENAKKIEEACVMFEQLTNTVRVFSGDVVQEKYKKSLARLAQTSIEYIKEYFASIECITHVKLDIKKKDIQPTVIDCLAGGADGISKLDFLKELTGEKQVYDDESVQVAYTHISEKYAGPVGDTCFASFDLFFKNLSIVSQYTKQYPVFKDKEQLAQEVYRKILNSSTPSEIVRWNEMWRLFSRTEPHYTQEVIDPAYQEYFNKWGIKGLESLIFVVKKTPSPDISRELYSQVLELGPVDTWQTRIKDLQRLMKTAPDFNQSAVDVFYKRLLSFNRSTQYNIDHLFALTGTRPSPEIVGRTAGERIKKSAIRGMMCHLIIWLIIMSVLLLRVCERLSVNSKQIRAH